MNNFADTSFLYALYRQQKNSAVADAFLQTAREPVRVSSLVLFEFSPINPVPGFQVLKG